MTSSDPISISLRRFKLHAGLFRFSDIPDVWTRARALLEEFLCRPHSRRAYILRILALSIRHLLLCHVSFVLLSHIDSWVSRGNVHFYFVLALKEKTPPPWIFNSWRKSLIYKCPFVYTLELTMEEYSGYCSPRKKIIIQTATNHFCKNTRNSVWM